MIRVEVDAKAALERFNRLAAEVGDRRVPNRQLATQLYGWTLRNFQQGGKLQNPVWPPLSPATAKQKAKKGYSPIPLIRTGHLRQSFRQFYDNEQAGVGSEVPYSEYHESGTDTLPQRAMLPPQNVAIDFAVRVYDAWIQKLSRTA